MKVASKAGFSLACFASVNSSAFCVTSTLFRIRILGTFTSASLSRIASASSPIPLHASMSTPTRSASCAPLQAVVTMARSSRRFGEKMPGVSMKISWVLPSTAMPRISARVVCTFRDTMVTLEPTSALSSVDLPALGAPISAMKPQRVSAVSSIELVRGHPDAREHGGGRGLFGGALRRAEAFRRRAAGQYHGDVEFRIVMRAGACELAIGRRRQPARLRPLLQQGFRIAQRAKRLEHALLPERLDQ